MWYSSPYHPLRPQEKTMAHTAEVSDWCPVCQAPRDIVAIEVQEIGFEEKTTAFGTIALSCGHVIVNNTNQEI